MAQTGRYRELIVPEATFQAGSGGRVLVNRLGLRSKRAMDGAEADALRNAQEAYYTQFTTLTRVTAQLLRAMHRDWLGEIYVWAGQYRTVELEKEGFRWPPAERVTENMTIFEHEVLARLTPCGQEELPQLSFAIAKVHAELLLIHPFREGNGRLGRWLADIMTTQAGFPAPAYGFSGRGSRVRVREYLEAVKTGYLQDYLPLARFFEAAILLRGKSAVHRDVSATPANVRITYRRRLC